MKIGCLALSFLVFFTACTQRVEYTRADPESPSHVININTASVEELETLPNIGRKTAESIVAYREANGPFRRPEHLMLIRGISESRFLNIRERLRTR